MKVRPNFDALLIQPLTAKANSKTKAGVLMPGGFVEHETKILVGKVIEVGPDTRPDMNSALFNVQVGDYVVYPESVPRIPLKHSVVALACSDGELDNKEFIRTAHLLAIVDPEGDEVLMDELAVTA